MNHNPTNSEPESDPRPRVTVERWDAKSTLSDPICKIDFRETHCKSKEVISPGSGDRHATVALSAYHIANLLDALNAASCTGDWWHEVERKLREAHVAIGEPDLISDDGTTWILNEGTHGDDIFRPS